MARPVYARAAQRGFPVFDYSGQSGQGALQDSTAPPPAAGLPQAAWSNPATDPASVPATLPPAQEYVVGPWLWGLPGSPNPDDTPRTHAAPFADPASLAIGDDEGTHAPVFTGQALNYASNPGNDIGSLTRMDQGRSQGQGSKADTLQPLSGQIRAMAGRDAVQGYGGGGPGPGGVNEPQGPVTDDMTFAGQVYKGQRGTFVSVAEVPRVVPAAAQFIASAPELPPYSATYNAPTMSVRAQDVIGADVPAQGPPLAAAAPAYGALPWG